MDRETPSDLISRRVPWRAALLGVAVTGLGQLYSGRPLRAVTVHVVSWGAGFVCLRVALIPYKPWNIAGAFATLFLVWAFILGDAVCCARGAPLDYRLKAYNRWYVYILVVVVVGVGQEASVRAIKTRYLQAFKIVTSSMTPSVMRGDRLLVDKRAYLQQTPQRGDIVAYRGRLDPSDIYLHRIVGIGGDVIKIEAKKVYVNGTPLVEPHAQFRYSTIMAVRDDFPPTPAALAAHKAGLDADWAQQMTNFIQEDGLHISPGHFFVMGDNRDASWDSRFWGFVPRADILGKASVIYFSWDGKARRVRWDRIGQTLK